MITVDVGTVLVGFVVQTEVLGVAALDVKIVVGAVEPVDVLAGVVVEDAVVTSSVIFAAAEEVVSEEGSASPSFTVNVSVLVSTFSAVVVVFSFTFGTTVSLPSSSSSSYNSS